MSIVLHHFFILTEPGAAAGDALKDLGLKESFSRDHPGQGTTNRRFQLANSMLELLWVRDKEEAKNGPGKKLNLVERFGQKEASPFGLILGCQGDTASKPPFSGWSYQPNYFAPPMAFHVGNNSEKLLEPLCIYASFMQPLVTKAGESELNKLSCIKITTTANPVSEVLQKVDSVDNICIKSGVTHLMEVFLDDCQTGKSTDLRPRLPLILHY